MFGEFRTTFHSTQLNSLNQTVKKKNFSGRHIGSKIDPSSTNLTPLQPPTMFRQAIRQVAKQSSVVRRTYATEAASASDALRLSLALPHQTLYSDSEVEQVNLPSVNGDLGILANHIPIVEQLRPGLLEIISKGGETEQYFVSGGIATVQPGNKLTISAIEAFKPTDIDAYAVKTLIADAQKRAESSDEVVVAEANIELEVLEALQHVAK